MLTRQTTFRYGHILIASARASFEGLLYPSPASTYRTVGTPNAMGSKKVGAADVALAACQIVQSRVG
jgi:hypothetical protein